MNFKNLLSFQIDTKLIQANLSSALQYLQSKIDQIVHNHEQMQHKVMALDLANQNSMKRHQKIQKFTFDNFRIAFNQLVTLKADIDQNIKNEPFDEAIKKSNLATIFEQQIGSFYKQTKVLNKRVSQLEIDIIKAIATNEQQTQKVKKDISKYSQEITGIRTSITHQFEEYQKNAQSKNQQIQIRIKQIATTLDQNQKKYEHNRISKTLDEKIQILSDQKKDHNKSKKQAISKLKKKLYEKPESQSSLSSQKSITHPQQKTKAYKSKVIKDPIQQMQQNQQMQCLRRQSMQAQERLIQELRQSLTKNLNQRMIQFQAKLQDLSSQSQKKQKQIQQLKRHSSSIQQTQTVIIQKLSDSKSQINNIKNSIYEIHQKNTQHSNILLENQAKFVNIQNFMKQLNSKVTQKLMEIDFQNDYRKFKPIQNSQKHNGLAKVNGAKTAYSSVHGEENHIQSRLSNLNQRLLKIEDKTKFGSTSNLPRIDSNKNITSSGRSSQSSFDIVKKQLQKVNQQLNKTNERVVTLKKNLRQLYDSHTQIPKKFEQIQRKIRQKSQLQQDRLLELIKQLINRCLTDPFNNNFTNTLKRQINIKFLQIKHEYSSIWKEIELRVADRAETSELIKLKQIIQSTGLELKSMITKKADNEDFKKGIKYMDAKIKQIYVQFKTEEVTQNKKYFMGKK